MQRKSLLTAAALAVGLTATGPALSAGDTVYMKESSDDFANVWLQVQDAVRERGFVIDYEGNVGAMLERTAEVSGGGAKVPYKQARYLQFCSSKLTHQAVAVDVQNIAMCPLVVFTYQAGDGPGKVVVGYRKVSGASGAASEKEMNKANALLKEIVDAAAE